MANPVVLTRATFTATAVNPAVVTAMQFSATVPTNPAVVTRMEFSAAPAVNPVVLTQITFTAATAVNPVVLTRISLTSTPVNAAPTLTASTLTARPGETVTLTASDTDGTIASWAQSGTPVILQGTGNTRTFVAPPLTSPGSTTFTVTDDDGATGTVTVTWPRSYQMIRIGGQWLPIYPVLIDGTAELTPFEQLAATTPQAPVSVPAMTTGYRVSGTQILDPAGNPFIPRGINIGGPKTDVFGVGMGLNATYAANAIAAGVNTVRIPNYATTRYPGHAPTDGWASQSGVAAGIAYAKQMIDFWRARGVVVIIDCHDFIAKGWTWSQLLDAEAYWADLANTYKSDSAVWFNLYNEVAIWDSVIDVPLSGNVATVRARWTGIHARACKIIRDAGAPNIIICDGFGMAQDPDTNGGAPSPKVYHPDCAPALKALYGVNLVVGWHNYGALGNTASAITTYINAVHAAGLPVIVGELGYPIYRGWDSIATDWWPRLRDAFDYSMATIPPLGVGLIFWSSAFGDSFSLYKPFWTGPEPRIINEFASPLPAGRSLSGQGVKYMAYLADGNAVAYSQSHTGGSAEE